MQTRHPLLRAFLTASWLAAFVVSGYAQESIIRVSFANPPKEAVALYVLTGQSIVVRFDQPIGRLAVSNLDYAEAVLVSPQQLVINGKASGRARFTTWTKDEDQLIFFDVDVRVNLAQIDSQVRALFPKDDIRLSQANGSVVISGSADAKVAQQVEQVVQAAGFKTVNLLAQAIQTTAQVQLLVRVAEVSRNKLAEYALNPAYQSSLGTGGFSRPGAGPYSVTKVEGGSLFGSVASSLNLFVMGGNAFAFLRALQQNGALRALAEPNLIAMNGQQASFLAGGEIPVPIVQGGNGINAVSIQWKEYGVRVNFKPTILDEQHIKLELEPEVSTLDYANAIELSGFQIPALRVRRARTGIELQDGQSFGIAGLLDNNETKSMGKIPVIGDVPILGNLFKSKSFQRNETELVFIVTAKLTKPLDPDAVPRFKEVDGLRDGSPLGIETPKAESKVDGTASELAKPTAAPAPETKAPEAKPPQGKAADAKADDVKLKAAVEAEPAADDPASAADVSPKKRKKGNGDPVTVAPTATVPTLPVFAFDSLQWTLTPPREFKAISLAAQLENALPAAPPVKQAP